MPCLCIVKKSLWCCPCQIRLRTPGIKWYLHRCHQLYILCLILWIMKSCLHLLPLEQYKLNWYSCVNDVNSSCQIFCKSYLPRPDEPEIKNVSNCGAVFISSKTSFDTSDENCQWTSWWLCANSYHVHSLSYLLLTSNLTRLCKMLLVTLHQIPISRTYPFLWFCHDTKVLNLHQ